MAMLPKNDCWDLEVSRATEEFFRQYNGIHHHSADDIHRRLTQCYSIYIADQVFLNIQNYFKQSN